MCADMTTCTYKQVNTVNVLQMRVQTRSFFFQLVRLSKTGFDHFHIGSQLQHEASVSMQFWDDPTVDGFHSLLMTPKPMIRTSDHVFQYGSIYQLVQQKLITSSPSFMYYISIVSVFNVS